jgi:hypothetical protein
MEPQAQGRPSISAPQSAHLLHLVYTNPEQGEFNNGNDLALGSGSLAQQNFEHGRLASSILSGI